MLSTAQIDHFRTFGFVVLRDFLADCTVPLHVEVDAALRDAYAATYDERVVDGISGHYLPMASRLTPVSLSLICDDPRFVDAAEALLDGPVIPECPEGVLYFDQAGWHDDDGIGVAGVKFATYFEVLDAATGALRFLPCSHHPGVGSQIRAFNQSRAPAPSGPGDRAFSAHLVAFPGVVAATRPGDVVAFDLHTWHASVGGRDRLAWTIVYQRCPDTDQQRERTLRSMADSFEQAFRGFNRQRYPIWRDWLADARSHPKRLRLVESMRAAGVLDLPGADIGW
jgi:hypothetical protein